MEYAKIESKYLCGIDLHDKSHVAAIYDRSGKLLFLKKINNNFDEFKEAVRQYKNDMAVGVESTHNYYWLYDGCQNENIPFFLGHALYMKAIRGKKKKDDIIDAKTIGHLMRTNFFPKAYPYPKEKRAIRDLLRRRTKFVSIRAGIYSHLFLLFSQQGQATLSLSDLKNKATRRELLKIFNDEGLIASILSDLNTIDHYDKTIASMEKLIIQKANQHSKEEFKLLKTFPGIGDILALIILYEMDTYERFPSVQKFSSYSRVVRCQRESSGKRTDNLNQKVGNPYLKWAFSEASVFSQRSEAIALLYKKLVFKYGKSRALTVLSHKIASAVFRMLQKKEPYSEEKFVRLKMSIKA